jgi:hypothetical protein
MKTFPKLAAGVLVVAVISLISTTAAAQNAVTDWNAIAIANARASTAPGAATPGGTNLYVEYVELAVYNAVVSIQGGYQPYKYDLIAPLGASPDAAAIEAAYRMLVHLLPDRFGPLTTAYAASLATIPDGAAKLDGQSVGLASANSLIASRAGDGLGVPWPYSFPSSPVPGVWILTPGAAAPATPWVGQMRPFTFDDPSEYMPDEPPPALSSQTWADDYNQVKALGAVNSTVRTPAQTEIGLFWTEHPGAQYGAVLRLLALQENLTLLESARLMAMTYSSMADSYIGCFNAKYHFSFWRPVTAIRNGDIDGNPQTVADPTWTPLGTTPGHPEYPAAHGCVTGGFAAALQAYFGTPRIQLSVSSSVTGTTHHFTSVQDLQKEVEYARIYAGFHYHHSVVQGLALGHKVAHNVAMNYFQPVK